MATKFFRHLIPGFLLLFIDISQANWVQTSGPINESVHALAVKGTDLFAGSDVGGVFLSSDSGSFWAPVNNGLGNLNISSLFMSGADLFVGANSSATGVVSGAFRTSDNGASWTVVNTGLMASAGGTIAVTSFCKIGTNLFAGASSGVYKSINNGSNWARAINGLNYNYLNISSLFAHGTNLFIGNGQGVYRSTDTGASWTQVNNGLTDTIVPNSYVLSFAAINTILFAGTLDSGVFRSSNNGAFWTAINRGLGNPPPRFIQSLFVNGANLFAGTDQGAFYSSDSGGSWKKFSDGLINRDVRSFAVIGSNLFAGTGPAGYFGGYAGVWIRSLAGLTPVAVRPSQVMSVDFEWERNIVGVIRPGEKLEFKVNRQAAIKLNVYDAMGTKIATLVNAVLTPGAYHAAFDASLWTGGLYFFRLQAGGLNLTRKIVLVK